MDWQVLNASRLADAAVGALIVLAAGSLAARLCRQPVRRVRLVVLSLFGAMAVPALGALPVAPRWSVGLPAAPAAILAGADHAATVARTSTGGSSCSCRTTNRWTPLPGRLEPLRRHGRGRRDRLRLGAPLGAAPPAADDPVKGAQAVKDAAEPKKDDGKPLHYKGTVVDKDTGKPIPGATVTVRRSILRSSENRVLQETRHTTGSRRYVRLRDPAGSVCLALPLHRAGRGAPGLRPPGRVRLRPEHDPQE